MRAGNIYSLFFIMYSGDNLNSGRRAAPRYDSNNKAHGDKIMSSPVR